jgi:hypothetical protein
VPTCSVGTSCIGQQLHTSSCTAALRKRRAATQWLSWQKGLRDAAALRQARRRAEHGPVPLCSAAACGVAESSGWVVCGGGGCGVVCANLIEEACDGRCAWSRHGRPDGYEGYLHHPRVTARVGELGEDGRESTGQPQCRVPLLRRPLREPARAAPSGGCVPRRRAAVDAGCGGGVAAVGMHRDVSVSSARCVPTRDPREPAGVAQHPTDTPIHHGGRLSPAQPPHRTPAPRHQCHPDASNREPSSHETAPGHTAGARRRPLTHGAPALSHAYTDP